MEISEWLAFAQSEPIGGARGDFQAALVASIVAETHRDHDRRRQPFAPDDFLPEWGNAAEAKAEPQSAETLLAIVEMLNAAMGGDDLRSPLPHPHPNPLPEGEGTEGA